MKYDKIYNIPDTKIYFGAFRTFEKIDILPNGSIFIYHPSSYVSYRNIHRVLYFDRLAKLKGIKFIYGTGSVKECQLLNFFGKYAVHLNHNIHVNENSFNVIYDSVKEYDFMLVSQLLPVKRIHLAKYLPNLSLITYGDRNSHFSRALLSSLSGLKFVNSSFLNTEEMNLIYNKSKIYVILSKREGPNLASVEALLCGLPILTTQSVGGRDYFITSLSGVYCDDTPESVYSSANSMLLNFSNGSFDPHLIRKSTLQIIEKFRLHFSDLCQKWVPDDNFIKHKIKLMYSSGINNYSIQL